MDVFLHTEYLSYIINIYNIIDYINILLQSCTVCLVDWRETLCVLVCEGVCVSRMNVGGRERERESERRRERGKGI